MSHSLLLLASTLAAVAAIAISQGLRGVDGVHMLAQGAAASSSPPSSSSSLSVAGSSSRFGKHLLSLFGIDEDYVNLNHGSYGSVPNVVLDAANGWRRHVEKKPDLFYRFEVYDIIPRMLKRLASYIGADAEDVVFVENASHGVNAVLRSMKKLHKGKKILYLNLAYQMVKNTLEYLSEADSDALLEVNITLPDQTDDDIVEAVRQALEANKGSVHIASFSHITSIPSTILPVERLIKLCREHGVLVLIDGAHALGQIPLNMKELDPDFYVCNGHKWLYSPKGTALLYVKKSVQHLVEPTTISWEGKGKSHFQAAFSYQGTADFSNYLAMEKALDFRESVGGEEAIMNYIHNLAVEGGKALAKEFGTELLFSHHSRFAAMVDVKLPPCNSSIDFTYELLHHKPISTYVPVYSDNSGNMIARVSAQIYNDVDDFRFLAKVIKEIIKSHE
eukprot:g3205.t1